MTVKIIIYVRIQTNIFIDEGNPQLVERFSRCDVLEKYSLRGETNTDVLVLIPSHYVYACQTCLQQQWFGQTPRVRPESYGASFLFLHFLRQLPDSSHRALCGPLEEGSKVGPVTSLLKYRVF